MSIEISMYKMIKKHAELCDLDQVDKVIISNMNKVSEKVYNMWDRMLQAFS